MKPPDKFPGPSVSRRTFIAGAALIPVAAIRGTSQAAAQPTVPVTVLTTEQRRILGAFVNRLMPGDELGPSATECGVLDYIEGSLADFLAPEKPAFLQGLAALDDYARTSQGAPLAELSAEKQDAVLTAIDGNEATELRPFFNRVRRLTLEGMFGDPSYGGNRNFAGWDLIRYPGAKMRTTPQDQRMSVAPVPYREALYTGKGGHHDH